MTTVTNHDSRSIQFMSDYCPRCNPRDIRADSRVRLASLTEPTTVTWRGGKGVICAYHCDVCGHQWTRADLWTAECAGFDPKQQRDDGPTP